MNSRSIYSYRMILTAESILLVLSLGLASIAIAQTYPNAICAPTTVPVTECECPLGASHNDRCIGTLPKNGSNWYGNVSCTGTGSSCTIVSGGANDCGIITMCPCITCGQAIVYYDNSGDCLCTNHPEKPPCTHKWGPCELAGYDPNP